MDRTLRDRREAALANGFTSPDFQKCLQTLEAAGPLRIPPNMQDDSRRQTLIKDFGWISNCDEYSDWMTSEKSQLLRLVWSPTGPTTGITEFLIEKVKQKTRDSSDTSLACFFCDNQENGVDTPATLLRSLMFQLLLQNSRLFQHIRADFEKEAVEGYFEYHLNNVLGLWRNFQDMLEDDQAGPVFIVVDALDACRGPTRPDLLRSIKNLFHELSSKVGVKVKLLVTYAHNRIDIDGELGHVGVALDFYERRLGATPAENTEKGSENQYTAMDRDSCFKPLQTTNHETYISMTELLLKRGASTISKDNRYGRSPLSWAAESGQESLVRLFLDRGVDIECRDKLGQTPLSFAAEMGHEAVVRLLVCAGGNIDTEDGNGCTPLLRATKRGHLPIVRFLLENGARVNCESNNGQTPVSVGAENGHSAIVQALLANRAAADTADSAYGRTPLSRAAENGQKTICQILLDEGGVEIDSRDKLRQTPLLWAAKNGHEGCVALLLHYGAVTSVTDSRYNQTSMIWACRSGHQSIVKLLLDDGADINLGDKSGRTPLSWAAEYGEIDLMKLLLNSGANINYSDENGRTPLSWAAGNGQTGAVRQLLDRNADFSLGDRNSRTPVSWALENAYGCIVTILRENDL